MRRSPPLASSAESAVRTRGHDPGCPRHQHRCLRLAATYRPPGQIVKLAFSGVIQMYMTGSIYAEYEEVIRRPRLGRSDEVVDGLLRAVREIGIWVRPNAPILHSAHACSDPDDNIFLECAQEAHADYVVTGNLKHFPDSWGATRVITPRQLLDIIEPASTPPLSNPQPPPDLSTLQSQFEI